MTEKESRPGGYTGTALSPTGNRTDTGTNSGGSDIVDFDWRCRARLTEQGMEPIDVALTFTGLAAEMREVAP